MKWIKRTTKETEIIGEILDSYSVRYKVTDSKGNRNLSDIEANITPEFYAYLCNEIDKKVKEYKENEPDLKEVATLEYMYSLPSHIKPTEQEYSKEISEIDKKIQEIQNSMDKRLNELPKMFSEDITDGIKGLFDSLFSPTTVSMSIMSEMTSKFIDLDIGETAKNKLKRMLFKYVEESVQETYEKNDIHSEKDFIEKLRSSLQTRIPESMYGLIRVKVNGNIVFE